MTFKKPASLIVSSQKGNTLGILDYLEDRDFEFTERITKFRGTDEIQRALDNADIILLGVSTYSSTYQQEPEFPHQIARFQETLESMEGKQVILFGSGRSEYPLFCGALDYFEEVLKEKNTILAKYKFEGYPREYQKREFEKLVKGYIYADN
ncbi:putative flavodoxin [Bacillus phage vB_BspM_MarvelLand]|nr:putative flavodoxin [Bacillus phage vB_BspM_MarvelLand]